MSKKAQNTRLVTDGRKGAVEQQIIVDDHPLPSADELLKLKEVDPAIVQWIMNRADKEQDNRHNFNNENARYAHRELGSRIISLLLAFVIAMSLLGLSAWFIFLEKEIVGTIFGGVGMIFIVQGFLKFGQRNNKR